VESKDQVVKTINNALGKLNGSINKTVFNQETDTRGHFNKEIL
jgi:putative protease